MTQIKLEFNNVQQKLFDISELWEGMPRTRYQGSKRKVLAQLYAVFRQLNFETCLDAFGGTGSVTHCLTRMGKRVTFNDILPSNFVMANALFANEPIVISKRDLENLFNKKANIEYRDHIAKFYQNVYYLDEENDQLDVVTQNIARIDNHIQRYESYYLLFQAMLRKRPYNLFHRANLHMRTSNVQRSFGNKTTWEKPFLEHMMYLYEELRNYREIPIAHPVRFSCTSAFEMPNEYDLIYIDTPYAKGKGPQESNYFNFYHFLDAILDYNHIPYRMVSSLKHHPIYKLNKSWYPHDSVKDAFLELFRHFRDSTLVVSYRSDGHPTVDDLVAMLQDLYVDVQVAHLADYKYVLSTEKPDTKEIAIIATSPKVY